MGSSLFAACAAGDATEDLGTLNPSDAGADSRASAKSDAATHKDSSAAVPVFDASTAYDASDDARVDASDAQVKDAAAGKDSATAKDSAVDAAKDSASKDVAVDAPSDAAPDASSIDAGTIGTLTCAAGSCLVISEVYEGASNDKALEIYNACAANIDLTSVEVCIEFNTSSYCKNATGTGNTILLTGTLKPNETFVICHSSISSSIACDKLDAKLSFNGNDRIALLRNNSIVDVFGELGKDPGDLWVDQDYRRKTCGTYLGAGTFATTSYVGQASGDLSDLGQGP